MYNFHSPCSSVFVCAVTLCWNLKTWEYAFVNRTECTPSPLPLRPNMQLIPPNARGRWIKDTDLINGFICSSCGRANFFELDLNETAKRCHAEPTMIQLNNYCQSSSKPRKASGNCQCLPANQSIEPIRDWKMAQVKPGKGDTNSLRVNRINRSASASVYLLVAFVFASMLLGGLVSAIFYVAKLRPRSLKPNK